MSRSFDARSIDPRQMEFDQNQYRQQQMMQQQQQQQHHRQQQQQQQQRGNYGHQNIQPDVAGHTYTNVNMAGEPMLDPRRPLGRQSFRWVHSSPKMVPDTI